MSEKNRIILTPAEAARIGVQYAERLAADGDNLVRVNLPGLDEYFAPLRGGTLTIIQAQTHNYKSGFMRDWAHRLARQLYNQGSEDAIVWVDTENTQEQLAINDMIAYSHLSDADLSAENIDSEKLSEAAIEISKYPIYQIATRLSSGKEDDVTLTNIARSIFMLANGDVDGKKRRIAAVFIDYLQTLPYDPEIKVMRNAGDQRRMQVIRDLEVCRRMGSVFDTPIILGAQAKQQLSGTVWSRITQDEREDGVGEYAYIPGMYDMQETSYGAQRMDRGISLWMPTAAGYEIGDMFKYGRRVFTVSPGMLFVKIIKQRGVRRSSGATYVYSVDFDNPFNYRLMHSPFRMHPEQAIGF